MKSIPGTASWTATFMGFQNTSDWDFNNGGTVVFSDGTIWSYDAESPVVLDQAHRSYPFPDYGFSICEWRPSTNMWERLTPGVWGETSHAQVPGYPNWPSQFTYSYTPNVYWLNSTQMSGPLNVALIGREATDWVHVQDGDDVWFYSKFADDELGPIKIDREKRTWQRFITSSASQAIWRYLASNIVISGDYMYFLSWGTLPNSHSWCRADKSDPNNVTVLHQFSYTSSVWAAQNTDLIDMPNDLLDGGMRPSYYNIAIDGDYVYLASESSSISDTRTDITANFGDYNYTMQYSCLYGFKVGDYTLEILYWHDNQGWRGEGADGSFNYGSWNWGTVGIDTKPGEMNMDRVEEPRGMGYRPMSSNSWQVRDGWLYWIDESGYYGGAYGTAQMLCRLQLSRLSPATETTDTVPVKHDPLDPAFEVIANGSVPWEGNAGHLVRYGEFTWWRDGGAPILPHEDETISFTEDGSILYKGMMFPSYYTTSGDPGDRIPEWGIRGIIKLTPPDASFSDVTVTFTGTALTGYGNVREVPTSEPDIEVHLGGTNV